MSTTERLERTPRSAVRVHEVMTRAVVTARPETSVADGRALMEKERIRHLPVTGEDGELLGIVTDRGIRRSLPSPVSSLSVWEMNYLLAKLRVEEIMTTAVITIGPYRDVRRPP